MDNQSSIRLDDCQEPSGRAVIVATVTEAGGCFSQGRGSPLTPLVDRPFLQHVVESLIDGGVRHIDFLLHDYADAVESHFQDGKRWGALFDFHLIHDPNQPYGRLGASTFARSTSPFLLMHSHLLGYAPWFSHRPVQSDCPVVYCSPHKVRSQGDIRWTGAAWIDGSLSTDLKSASDFRECEYLLLQRVRSTGRIVMVPPSLDGSTFCEVLDSQSYLLSAASPARTSLGTPREEGIWIHRNATLDAGTHLIPPIYIGHNCQIDRGVKLGPNVVISEGCYVRPDSTIRNSLVLPNTLIGEGLTINGCVVNGCRLFHIEHDVALSIDDSVLLGNVREPSSESRWLKELISRSLAVIALLLCSPLIAVVAVFRKLRNRPTFIVENVVRLPAPHNEERWETFPRWCVDLDLSNSHSNLRHFLAEFVPGLISVARGDVKWVGVKPLSKDRLRALPWEWRDQYLDSEGGLISESCVQYGTGATFDEMVSAEIYFASTVHTLSGRLKRIVAYFLTIGLGPRCNRLGFRNLLRCWSKAMVR